MSVILSTPILWIGYGTALFLCLYEILKKATYNLFSLLSIVLTLASTVYALILGASLYEVGVVILIFLVINLIPNIKSGNGSGKGGEDK